MQTTFFFKNMHPDEQTQLQDYFFKKMPALEKILSHFPQDGVVLQVKGEKFQKHSAYEVEFIMKLPSETISAREASHMLTKAVDLAKDRLTMQLKREILSVRRGHRSIKARNKIKLRTVTIQ